MVAIDVLKNTVLTEWIEISVPNMAVNPKIRIMKCN